MPAIFLDPRAWAVQQFGQCVLGDQRRNKRLMKFAMQIAARPDGSTPDQTEGWADCKAAYRLFDQVDLTFDVLVAPHFDHTRRCSARGGVQLLINDTTEIDFGHHRKVNGLGPTGNGSGLGFFLHSSLMFDPLSRQIEGLAGQKVFYRKPKSAKKAHKNSRRRSKQRESLIWGKLIDEIGAPPEGTKWIHVCDRGADDFEVFHHALRQKCSFVIRASKLNRLIIAPDDRKLKLQDYLLELPVQGTHVIPVRASKKSPARTATVELRYGRIGLPRPRVTTDWIRQNTPKAPLLVSVVELREVHPPKGATPLRWVLYTLEAIDSTTDAELIIGYYEQRPLIEDYHKALKTGCHVEERQYATAARLERVTAVLSILAVRLLQIKTIARDTPERPAHEVAPARWVEILQRVRQKKTQGVMTIHEFIRQLAGLGGHLGRKGDGQPGWITLWRGLEKLLLILRGADVVRHAKCG
jgi:hypothetical protein